MAVFWSPEPTALTDANFLSSTDTQVISRPETSKRVMKAVMPEAFYRRFVSKWTDFREGAGNHMIMYKKMTRPETQGWQPVDEFQTLPNISAEWKQFSVFVEERGVQFPFTLRAQIYSNIDLENEIREHVKDVILASIERDLLRNAFVYLDVLGFWDGTNLTIHVGKSLAPDKTFSGHATTYSITITQQPVPTTLGNLTMDAVRKFALELVRLNAPSYDGQGYGRYLVVINHQAWLRLSTDPEFFTAMTRLQDRDALRNGYIGHYYGLEFVLDRGKWIDNVIAPLQPNLAGKAICLFLSQDAIREAIVRPEEIRTERGNFNRFSSIGVFTYRGESPTWFAVEGIQAVGGWLVGA